MKIPYSLPLYALALLAFPSLAHSGEPNSSAWVKARVQSGLLAPLAKKEGKRKIFSRARPVPRERRVRAEQTTASVDKAKRAFMPFSIDVRFGDGEWKKDDLVGCAYRKSGRIFVKIGDAYRPAEYLLGKDAAPEPGVCEAAPVARS